MVNVLLITVNIPLTIVNMRLYGKYTNFVRVDTTTYDYFDFYSIRNESFVVFNPRTFYTRVYNVSEHNYMTITLLRDGRIRYTCRTKNKNNLTVADVQDMIIILKENKGVK